MVNVLTIVVCLIIAFAGIGNMLRLRSRELVGTLLRVYQEGEDRPIYMLEIYEGNKDKIKKGEYVLMYVDEEHISAPEKQPS